MASWVTVIISVLVAVLTFLLAAAILVIRNFQYLRKHLGMMPSDKKFHWLYGSMQLFPGFNEDGLAYLRKKLVEYPRFRVVWMGVFRAFIDIHHPEVAKQILKTTEPKSTGPLGLYHMGLPWLGEGLLMSHGSKWNRNRRLITPAFQFGILEPYVDVYNKAADILLSKLQGVSKDDSSADIFHAVNLCTLDIILKCAFSSKEDIQLQGENNPYVNAVRELNDIWVMRTLNPFILLDFIFNLTSTGRRFRQHCKYVHSVAEEIIEKRRITLENEGLPKTRYYDFLDIILSARDEDGKGLSPLEIRNEVDTFLLAGHDTTASAISWTLHSLASHPEIQETVQEELDRVITNKDYISYKDIQQLDYLACCIKESMRMNPAVGYIQRVPTRDIIIDEYTVPAGIPLSVNIYAIHHNPEVWDEPMEYRPERFFPENIVDRDTFAFIPFSAGPRNCIGQHLAMDEQRVIISRILNRYTLTLDPNKIARRKPRLVLKAEDGIHLFMVSREKSE